MLDPLLPEPSVGGSLVEAAEDVVVALVQRSVPTWRQIRLPQSFEGQSRGLDGPYHGRGERRIESKTFILQASSGRGRLVPTDVGERRIELSRKMAVGVRTALTVAGQDEAAPR